MGLFEKHYDKVAVQRENFEKMLAAIETSSDETEKFNIALTALSYAAYRNTGYFTSSFLEAFFVDVAKGLKTELTGINFKPNSFLHVLSQGYNTGGHTRVVERWIENAPSEQTHSVVVLNPAGNVTLATLEKNARAKNGEFVEFERNADLKECAIRLRKMAMWYEFVVLHVHMDDPTAVMAFGSEDFTRPVMFYNHASHLFSLGKSVTDLFLDIIENDETTSVRRGVKEPFFLGVPSKEIRLTRPDKAALRERLNLPLGKKIIITSATAAKFRPIDNENIIDLIAPLIDENTICYAIGAQPGEAMWRDAHRQSGGKITALGYINFDEGYMDYLAAADLYLDSYPMPGGTAMIDAIAAGTPALSLRTAFGQFDYLTQTSAYCHAKDEFIKKAQSVLDDAEFAQNLVKETQESLLKYQSIAAWNAKIARLLQVAPREHRVRDLRGETDYCEIDDLCVQDNIIHNDKFLTTPPQPFSDDVLKNGFLYKSVGVRGVFVCEKRYVGATSVMIFKLFGVQVARLDEKGALARWLKDTRLKIKGWLGR